jgi:CBS domain-containing protein
VADAEDTLRSAARTLWRENVGALVVLDNGRRPRGILSERDLVARVAKGDDLDAVTVGEAMQAHLVAARPGDTAHDVAYQMLEYGIRHLPVLDDEGRVVGLISIRDVLRPVVAR